MKTLSILALIASSSIAFADGTSYDISGTTVGKSIGEYIQVSDTQLFAQLDSSYTLPDNGTPMAGMEGKCLGSLHIGVGSGASGTGMCVWSDADGDTWFGPWTVTGMTPDRASVGNWHVAGGTGKFATTTGGGTFMSLTNPETGDSKLDVQGSVNMN